MPKGYKTRKTLDKEAARAVLREMVFKELRPMVEAQVANAQGIKYLVVREKGSGKFVRVGEAMAKLKIGQGEEIVEVWEKDPSVHAFATLLDQTIDQAPKHVELEGNLEHVYRWADDGD